MIKIYLLIFLLILFSSLSYLSESSNPKSFEKKPEDINENATICSDIIIYLNITDKLAPHSLNEFKKKCVTHIVKIKKNFNHKDTIGFSNEFILSLIHMKSLHASGDETDAYNIKHILSKLQVNLNENSINDKVRDLIKFNKFLLDTSNVKDIEEFLVLSSDKDEYMNESKKNVISTVKNSFKHHMHFFIKSEEKIYLKKEFHGQKFLDIYKEFICVHHIHLCQIFYQQVEIYLKMKAIFYGLINYIEQYSQQLVKSDLSRILSLNKKEGDLVQLLSNYALDEEEYVIKRMFMTNNTPMLELHKKDNERNQKSVPDKKAVKVIDLKKELESLEKYEELINLTKRYIRSITDIDADISSLVDELDQLDIEKFLLDLNFLINYGFLRITEEKLGIFEDDILLTYINLYRANNIIFLYLLKIKYEKFKRSEHHAYEYHDQNKIPTVSNETIQSHLSQTNKYTNLKEFDKNVIFQHFKKSLTEVLENFDVSSYDESKIEYFFTMAFKNCNINQNYSRNSAEMWISFLYTYDNYGWFFFNPNNTISEIRKEHFIRHILGYRNFIMRNSNALMHLDTQVSKLIDFIYLVLGMDYSSYVLNFSIQSNFFKYDFETFKFDNLKTKFSYDCIDSIANNYYFFNDEENEVFNTDYNDNFYMNLPNIYSLAYQLFNELAININVITNTPLKKRLKNRSSYAYFTIMNILGNNNDIYSKNIRHVFASYVLALVFFIESHIDISRYKPKDLFFLKQSYPLIDHKYADDFKVVEDNCKLLFDFMKIYKNSKASHLSHVEEVMKFLNLIIIVLWGKESKKSLYYDDDVSLYKKLLISCIFNGGLSIQDKLIADITKSCDISFYGITPKILKEIIEINLSTNKWNPVIIEKLAHSFVLNCKLQSIMYDSMNIENVTLKNFSKLVMAPEILRTYHCFKLGRQAAKLLESIILKKKFVRFRVNDAVDVYDFFFTKKVISNNIHEDFKEFLKDKEEYEKRQIDTILQHSPLSQEQTKILIDNYECYWFNNFENFKTLWMHVSSKLGTGTYIKNFFSEIWSNMRYLFKKKTNVKDVEYFPASISEINLLDYYSPLVVSEIFCQEQMQILFLTLKNDKHENRSEIPDKIKTAYFQCKFNYYRDNNNDPIHRLQPSHFMDGNVYVFKQPYYLIYNIDKTYKKKLVRLFLSEKTLEYLLMDKISIPECFGRCTTKNFNRVILQNQSPKSKEIVIQNRLVPSNIPRKVKARMYIYVNEAYIHNLYTDYLTNEKISKIDIENNSVKVCMGKSTYLVNSFLTRSHFDLSHKPVYDFNLDHNFYIFLKKNEHLIAGNPNHECFINYDLLITNIDVEDPYRDISSDLIKNLYILKNK
ncbi:high molecular weight rhoptry protein 2, putative [Plasmodium gallinaceum]|uniref:High molecular weight rhoptry protein 2, putative n=1 Tax=Plasmodium gallinaceum TaxID=5849 RepID=A0A1J1GWC2_PLAGA|nr:high molecular weight rhoptry protein 2, putative [Plasmodium gallinaceum]CRG96841.1 high molecular weight rhoptry protein 2, putative [Plasmodium gallinaceum]